MKIDVSQLALDYLYCIECEYKGAKDKKLSRMSVQWGKFSRGMNVATRQLIKENHPDSFMLKILYNAWVAYSELLEYNYRFPAKHRKKKQKRQLVKAIKIFKVMLETGEIPEKFEKYFDD